MLPAMKSSQCSYSGHGSDWKEVFTVCARSVHSVDSDLMYFVKAAVVSYAEWSQCVQCSFHFDFG